jgi:isochorismate synthase
MPSDQNIAKLIEQSDPRLPTADTWMNIVADTVLMLREGRYQKVVLSRGVQVTTEAPTKLFDIPATLYQLQQNYPETYLFALQHQERCFCGATPEQLASVHNGNVQTMALAGTARQNSNVNETDHTMNTELLSNGKDKKEHDFVVVMIRDFLETLCSEITISGTPYLLKLKNVQHLKTNIHGKLLPGHNILDVIAGLHPTPAVGGLPRPEALEMIRAREPTGRGWYAGPIGWLDADGNGEFSVALRSALVTKNSALLFAGCGIVADSRPEKEYEESCWKLQAMRQNLCVQEK